MIRKAKIQPLLLVLTLALFTMPSCNTSRAAKGAVIGGTVGGIAGGIIGKNNGNTAVGILIGSAIGGTAGALIGNYMDKQAQEIEKDLEGATVERVGEGILITFDSGLMFDTDSYSLKSRTKQNLTELSTILQKYEDTNILIQGHTDSQGSTGYNQTLSERRANAVSYYLAGRGVVASRISETGFGESKPIASNASASGRQQNRRVEVAIYANKKLQKAAKRGDI
ncbi:MAG: OmpA family protein [Saprospiraceae bacterium]|nr:OmpA family protein [Saprospiraceae bacterium]